jgi:hypothetical protein
MSNCCSPVLYILVEEMEGLKEMDEYDMSGRCVVPELWSYRKKSYCSGVY